MGIMATFNVYANGGVVSEHIKRICLHHDHLKYLISSFDQKIYKETFERMADEDFQCNSVDMAMFCNSYFTSIIVTLSNPAGSELLKILEDVYKEISHTVIRHYPESKIDISSFESAHITIKCLVDNMRQGKEELEKYLPFVGPIIEEWVGLLGGRTTLYAQGLFTNLHPEKGLAVGVRFFPDMPLIQIMRGELGVELYRHKEELVLRDEDAFHTELVHSTGFRARNLQFPLAKGFIAEFREIIERYDNHVFGSISDITLDDIVIRNGFSDKLIPHSELHIQY